MFSEDVQTQITSSPRGQDWPYDADDGARRVLQAACKLFAKHGYDATSIRSIAEETGLSIPGIYYHYQSKQAILEALVIGGTARMLSRTQAADQESDGTGIGRFDKVVGRLLHFHLERRDDAFVASSEMRSMDKCVLLRHIAQRDAQQKMITEIIEQGIREGVFQCSYVKEASRAIASLCVSVSSWYRPDGPLSTDELVERYLEIAHRIVGLKNVGSG